MLTPRFTVDQDDEFVYITIKLSTIRFSAHNVEMVVNDKLFIFALPPYYLRLRFPGSLEEDERATSKFVSKEECIKVRVAKKTKGENFPDLDLTAKLLARLNEPTNQSISESHNYKSTTLIEEIESNENGANHVINNHMSDIAREAENFNWEVEQKSAEEMDVNMGTEHPKYGFNNQYSDMLEATVSNGNDINELAEPDGLKSDDRVVQRLIKENLKFDPEYYANEYLTAKYTPEESRIREILKWESPYKSIFLKLQREPKQKRDLDHVTSVAITFSQKEQDLMRDLPKKSYLIDDPRPIYYTIICLLYAYCYEIRSNEGDSTVESGWTIGKLTPQISCLDSQLIQSNNMTEKNMLRILVITMDRRALSYPLIRSYEVAKKCWEDVYFILRCGKRSVLKASLAAREYFRFHDIYYIYCKILLDDLCNWILRDDGCNERVLRNLAHALRKEAETIVKKDLMFEKIMTEESEDMEFINIDDVEDLAEHAYKDSK
ncbi:hypothetical protein FOA43_002304 [Brettanomyces nanus]|uniref:CS domain-containing protein n=1 Tax=Eeniella nana TaxID=13502 RepID=A0A875S3L6_EENNA|nr:uncharacterized protein FOA43_002304 [Brettanomyces nanus]QPG74965.1 hypothetical protein FOA43_002304 [Brettanomyces nanus]